MPEQQRDPREVLNDSYVADRVNVRPTLDALEARVHGLPTEVFSPLDIIQMGNILKRAGIERDPTRAIEMLGQYEARMQQQYAAAMGLIQLGSMPNTQKAREAMLRDGLDYLRELNKYTE